MGAFFWFIGLMVCCISGTAMLLMLLMYVHDLVAARLLKAKGARAAYMEIIRLRKEVAKLKND